MKAARSPGPIRIAHVYRTYFPETQGGLQEAIRQISLGTAQHGVVNTVFALAKDPYPRFLKVPEGDLLRERSFFEVASCDFGGMASFRTFRKLADRVDLFHFHYPWPFGDLLGILGRKSKPFVVTYQSDVVRQRSLDYCYAPLRRAFFNRAAAVVTTSPGYRNGSAFLGQLRCPVHTIPLCIDRRFVPPIDTGRSEGWRAQLGAGYFLFVGVLRYYKGLDFLIAAASMTRLPVVIAGDGPEGERLRALASGLANVTFVGQVTDEDKYALIDGCRAVVFPSHLRSEAFGMTLLEAAIRRRPMISAEIGTGTSFVNAHNVTGFVVPPADATCLASAMQRLAAEPELAARMGAAAYDRYLELFSADRVGAQYAELYKHVLSGTLRA
ncbi:glycosyltransferase [Niveibacterium sp. COAC-50]|uniref:glycosyltransferase n=1 Tax=Niveibacterium sp. COAC-50 TaxID=2729384 RepID=UPI001C131C52|nr:glycosyltransferase [Niveibacterium sp. COAC-50]